MAYVLFINISLSLKVPQVLNNYQMTELNDFFLLEAMGSFGRCFSREMVTDSH